MDMAHTAVICNPEWTIVTQDLPQEYWCSHLFHSGLCSSNCYVSCRNPVFPLQPSAQGIWSCNHNRHCRGHELKDLHPCFGKQGIISRDHVIRVYVNMHNDLEMRRLSRPRGYSLMGYDADGPLVWRWDIGMYMTGLPVRLLLPEIDPELLDLQDFDDDAQYASGSTEFWNELAGVRDGPSRSTSASASASTAVPAYLELPDSPPPSYEAATRGMGCRRREQMYSVAGYENTAR